MLFPGVCPVFVRQFTRGELSDWPDRIQVTKRLLDRARPGRRNLIERQVTPHGCPWTEGKAIVGTRNEVGFNRDADGRGVGEELADRV